MFSLWQTISPFLEIAPKSVDLFSLQLLSLKNPSFPMIILGHILKGQQKARTPGLLCTHESKTLHIFSKYHYSM